MTYMTQRKKIDNTNMTISAIISFLMTIILLFLSPILISAQTVEGTWQYEVLNTLSGDYYGELIIKKEGKGYLGEIISRGDTYDVFFNYISQDSLSIGSNVEGFLASIHGRFEGNSFLGKVTVFGDRNIYDFNARKKEKEQIFRVLDDTNDSPIPYAHIIYDNEDLLSNEDGYFKTSLSNSKEITISAIGFKTKNHIIKGSEKIETIYLKTNSYGLPTVEVTAKGFSSKKIVDAAIERFETNYISVPYQADMFFRYTGIDTTGNMTYQSEAILKFHDSKGFKKRRWKKTAASIFTELQQGRIIKGKKKEDLELRELNRIFLFWTHEPIVAFDKPLTKSNLEAYDFKLIDIKEFQGNEVYEIEFNCNKLQTRYAGLPSLKHFKGKIYINKKDFAILKYEQHYEMDYEFKNKRTKKGWGGSERRIIRNSRIEIFSKSEHGYHLDYAKVKNYSEVNHNSEKGATKKIVGNSTEEYQFFNVSINHVKTPEENLLNIKSKVKYNPSFWKQFNIILK